MANNTLSLPLRNSFHGLYGIGFSGSREIPSTPAVRIRLHTRILESLYDPALPDMYEVTTGGCVGVDAFVADFCQRRGITFHTVMPPDRSKVDPDWREKCYSYEEIPFLHPGDKTGYKRRNQRIVNLSDRLIAFPLYPEDHPQSRRSGTWQTIRMGRRAGIMADGDIHILTQIARRP